MGFSWMVPHLIHPAQVHNGLVRAGAATLAHKDAGGSAAPTQIAPGPQVHAGRPLHGQAPPRAL